MWQAHAPDGERLLFVIPECIENRRSVPDDFVRAIPVTGYVRLAAVGDTVVWNEFAREMLVAHCWLEGPVSVEVLLRGVGRITSACATEVARARRPPASPPTPEPVVETTS